MEMGRVENIETIHRLLTLLEGDSVTIVGGNVETAQNLDLTDHVVWTNNHWLKKKDENIDVLFHCLGPRAPVEALLPELPKTMLFIVGPEWAIGRHVVDEWMTGRIVPQFITYGHDAPGSEWWMMLDRLVSRAGGNSPLTGLVAAWFFHLMPVKHVYLTGMNLYQGEKLSPGTAGHNPTAQAKVFDHILRVDKRFEADEVMTKAIKELAHGR